MCVWWAASSCSSRISKTVRCSSTSGTHHALDASNRLVEFAFLQNLEPVRSSVEADSGRYVYSLNTPARPGFTGDRFARDDLRSRCREEVWEWRERLARRSETDLGLAPPSDRVASGIRT